MNFIIKKIIKRVFEKYLNLEEQLNVESGLIKLPFGKINHQEINKKLEPFNIQISSSIYKNLSISIPLTQIVTKPIKISIERFQVLIAKKKRTRSQKAQQKQAKETQTKETQKSDDKIQIDEQVNKYSKNMPSGKEQVNSGYIKNMVNRLLYNMEILFEKIIIKVEKDEQDTNPQGFERYLSDVQFEIHQLHLRNSLVLLEANIIKKIFNLQQIIIKHKFAQLIINDFNICLDYNNRKVNIIAILGNILINVKEIPYKDIQKLIAPKKKEKQQSSSSYSLPLENVQVKNDQNLSKQKPIQLNIYMKLTQSTFQIQNFISLRGEMLELKFKKYHQKPKDPHVIYQKHTQAEILFKSLLFVHLNEIPYEEKDLFMVRYLPWCEQVKIFSQYQDNILKSSMIKFNQKEIHQHGFTNLSTLNKNESQINSATSFDDKKEENSSNESVKKQTGIHLYYLDLMADFQIIKKVFDKVTKNKELKDLISASKQKPQERSQNQIQSQKSLAREEKINQNSKRQEISVDFIVYRLMINVRIMQQLSVQLYGSFRGGYFLNSSNLDNQSLTESSIRKHPTKSGFASEYAHSHRGKHTNKKRSTNKQTAQRISQQQVEKQLSPSKIKSQSSSIKRSNFHQSPFKSDKHEQIRLEVIQLCVKCKNYKVLDFGNLEVKISKSKANESTQIVTVGTHINAELSIKLIKDIIDIFPLIQTEANDVFKGISTFIGEQDIHIKNAQQNIERPLLNKEPTKKSKTTIFLKLNEVNIKLGSLVRFNQLNQENKEKFVWIFLLEISNLSIGAKLVNAFKLKFSTMIYLTSPQTLHRISITRNPVEFKVDFKNKKQTLVSICNDLQLDLNQKSLQILLKYFSQITNSSQEKDQNNKISDNDCYFVEFYNATQKQIKIIQSNQYEASENSIDLSQFDENDHNHLGTKDYKIEEKTNLLKSESSSSIFWLNEFYIIIVIDGYRSQPISLEFDPLPVSQVKYHSKFTSEYEETIKFEQENEKVQNKYVIHFLLNFIGKIKKIILKNNVCFISYKNSASILHENSQLIAYSNLTLQNSQNKITDNYITDHFRNQKFNQLKNAVGFKQFEVNYEFLLDLNEQSKNITFNKGLNGSNQLNYKVSSLLLRSPNAKPQNSIYSLFGIYRETQLQKQKEESKIAQRLFESYLYQIRHLQTSYFVEMPFLIIQNNLSCEINLEILDKKTQILKIVKLNPLEKKDLYSNSFQPSNEPSFDFYNKQFTMKIKLVSKTKNLENELIQNQVFYQSEEHYFNTFFMVEHQFQTLIALRSNKKYQFDKKYLFLRQELMLKTKVLKLESSCRIINKTNFNFGLKFKRSTLGEVKSPKKQVKAENQTQSNSVETSLNYVLLPSESQNNHFMCHKKSQIQAVNQFRAQQTLEILFENLEQTKIEVHEEMAKQGLIQILSFNFAKKDIKQNVPSQKKYNHLLFRLRLKTIENHQFIIIQNFITLKNLSLQNITLSLQPQKDIKQDEQVIFPLPPTTIKKFNNKVIILSNLAQIQTLYEELFAFGLDDKSNSALKNKKITSDKSLQQSAQKTSETIFLTVKDKTFQVEQNIPLKDLLFTKNNLKQVNLGKKGTKLFSLLKDIKGGIIRLFFLEKLFNPNLSYVLLNNQTSRNFLISSDKSEYTHHFVKNPALKENSKDEEKSEKIFVCPKTFSILSNKDDFEILLCDEHGKHLEKTSKQNLEKEGLQMQFHTTQNFQLIDLLEIPEQSSSKKQVSNEPKLSIKTHLISIHINLYSKIYLNLSVSNLGVRILEKNKIDCLVQDISIKNTLTNEHILRIPEESYVLFQGKIFGNEYNTNFILIKNLFVKCKNIIVNLQKDLPYKIICLLKNLIPNQPQGQDILRKKYYFDNEGVRLFFQSIQSNEGLQKLKSYLKQQLFLIKNIYLHEIHLSLSLDLQNNNFSNVMVIPQYQMTNSFMRENNMFKEIGQFYKTNILAKLPKLSFIFTNLKNPLNLIRTMMKVSFALSEKIEQRNVLTFDHEEIPENELMFSLQRWNFMHRKGFIKETSNPEDETQKEQLLTFLYKNECYYLISNRNFIILSLNSKNISKEQEGTLIHYESNSEESFGSRPRAKWLRTYENSMMRILPLKDLEKIKLIRNKKYSEFAIQFKGNITVNICDEYEKCAKLIDTINSLVM